MKVKRQLFREYDIRGIVPKDIDEGFARHLGQAVGTRLIRAGGKSIVIGRDCRTHGEGLERSFVEGCSSAGCHVYRIGVCPTPVCYWACQHLDADGSVQITGSHNPADYNGFKITMMGDSLHGDDIQELHGLMESEDYESGPGNVVLKEILNKYVEDLTARLNPGSRELKVVIDAGNGTAGITALPLYKKMGWDVVPLFCDMNGAFPNHHPDPTIEENLEDMKKAVAESGADLGIAFDGDGDRIGVIDEKGSVIWGDRLMVLLSRAVLKDDPGATIIGEVKCSKTMFDEIKKAGGKPIMWRTGHSLIKAKMKETNAALAGEMSGHIFYKNRFYGFDDATYAGARLLELLSHETESMSAMLADVEETFSTPEIRRPCPEDDKFRLVKAAQERFRERQSEDGTNVIDIDGVRVEWPDGWGLVRASNTQPILVLRFEASSQERLNEIQELFEKELTVIERNLG